MRTGAAVAKMAAAGSLKCLTPRKNNTSITQKINTLTQCNGEADKPTPSFRSPLPETLAKLEFYSKNDNPLNLVAVAEL